jgi:hypothetical protein
MTETANARDHGPVLKANASDRNHLGRMRRHNAHATGTSTSSPALTATGFRCTRRSGRGDELARENLR